MTNAEKREKITKALGDHLAEHLEKNGPVTNSFETYRVRFDVYGSENKGMMELTYKAPGELRLQLGVYRKGTDRLYSNYLPSAKTEEMIRYLKDPASHKVWQAQIAHLSDSVDDFWD